MATADHTELIVRRLGAGASSSRELEQLLGLSQSSVSRALRALVADGRVFRIGTTRGAKYGLRRPIEGIGDAWPIHRVNVQGEMEKLATLHALAADQYYLEATSTAHEAGFAWEGISEGIPYFLQDQRPGGFLGRAVPLRYPELRLPQRVIDWNDDHYLRYLTQRGSDVIGDLIVGTASLDDYLRMRSSREPIPSSQRETRYPQLASLVMEGGLPGSSAAGEHPKFACLLQEGAARRQVLVKFSPPADTPAGVRWSDLLVSEHLALDVLGTYGIAAATSQIFRFAGCTYLELDRFDRSGPEGRVGVTSLLAIDTSLYGQLDNWIAAAGRLHRDRRIDAETLERIRWITTFATLIANSDRHFGNLSFYDEYRGNFRLAPVYDMLPMLFAPEHNRIVARTFSAPELTADTLSVYARAAELAKEYWQRVAADERISQEFRAIAGECRTEVAAAIARVPKLVSSGNSRS
jgi:hypothetical protein